MHVFLVVVLLFVCLVFPLAYAWRVARLDVSSRLAWLIVVIDAAIFVALVLLVGRWDIAGYYTRYFLLAVFVAAVALSLWKHAARPWCAGECRRVLQGNWTTLVSLVFFGAALGYVLYGMQSPAQARRLAFPLDGGRFVVAHGGGIALLNHHAGHAGQRYAADISAIDEAGLRAPGILPDELTRYAIYGATVVSPCDGRVVEMRENLPDLVPPRTDRDNPAGNHVIIDCGEVNVELAHLQRDSIDVAPGDRLAIGDRIGKVGNSGNITEPHLHIHAFDPESGEGIPMSVAGRPPIRNRLYAN